MASPPASTKTSLGQKLRARARERWPQLTSVDVRFRGKFAYVTGQLPDGQELPLCRLRYAGYASLWGFAIYRASHDDYQDSILPSGQFAGTPEQALDCACGLYLADPTAWLPPETDTPTNLRARALATAYWRANKPSYRAADLCVITGDRAPPQTKAYSVRHQGESRSLKGRLAAAPCSAVRGSGATVMGGLADGPGDSAVPEGPATSARRRRPALESAPGRGWLARGCGAE
jgi:hypothetical protein